MSLYRCLDELASVLENSFDEEEVITTDHVDASRSASEMAGGDSLEYLEEPALADSGMDVGGTEFDRCLTLAPVPESEQSLTPPPHTSADYQKHVGSLSLSDRINPFLFKFTPPFSIPDFAYHHHHPTPSQPFFLSETIELLRLFES